MALTRILCLLVCVIVWCCASVAAQNLARALASTGTDTTDAPSAREDSDKVPDWHSMVTNIPGDWMKFGATLITPESLPYIAGVGSLTVGLVAADPRTYGSSRELYTTNHMAHSASDAIIHIGDGKTAFGMAGAFALYGFIAKDARAIRTASQIGEVVLASGIVVQLLKRVAGRESPEKCSGYRSQWHVFPNWRTYNRNQSKYYSFPSGHTTTIMGVVTVIAENYPEVGWLRPLGYTAVGLVGVSLVNVGWHWYSDLPLAIALGYTFGKIAAHPLQEDADQISNSPGATFAVAPMVRPEGSGIAFAVTF